MLKDKKLDTILQRDGYILGNFIPSDVLNSLISFYQNNQPNNPDPFHTTHFSKDSSYKKKINDGLIKILQPVWDLLLENSTPIFANFMIKAGDGNNAMPLHADWTYVDEPNYQSIAMWIPLVDTSTENGCLGVIPHSQHLSKHIRGPRITQILPPYDTMLIKKRGKLLPLKKGQAIIYNHRLLHYSSSNNSGYIRPAINISIVPTGIKIFHFTIPEGYKQIHKYAVDDYNFFIHYNNFQLPTLGESKTYIEPSTVPTIHNSIRPFLKKYPFYYRWKKIIKSFMNSI